MPRKVLHGLHGIEHVEHGAHHVYEGIAVEVVAGRCQVDAQEQEDGADDLFHGGSSPVACADYSRLEAWVRGSLAGC